MESGGVVLLKEDLHSTMSGCMHRVCTRNSTFELNIVFLPRVSGCVNTAPCVCVTVVTRVRVCVSHTTRALPRHADGTPGVTQAVDRALAWDVRRSPAAVASTLCAPARPAPVVTVVFPKALARGSRCQPESLSYFVSARLVG